MQRPPLFESDSFIYWKNRFETYVKSKDLNLWHVITNGDFQPIQQSPKTKLDEVIPFEKQSDDHKKRLVKNNEAKMVINNALPRKEYERIFMCNTEKEIWKTLLITHHGNNQVKDNKIDLLVQQYEQFVISKDESIDSAFARFNTIITSLKALDEGLGSTSGIRACALRNFDLEVMEFENTQNNALAKLPMLKRREAPKLVSRLAKSGVGYSLEDRNVKFLRSLPSVMWITSVMRARKFYQRTGRKIIIDGSNTAGYDKSKMVLDLIGVTWQRKRFRQTWLSWHSQILSDTDFKAATYKRGLATLEGQIVKYREHEVLFSEEIALLKRSVGSKEYELGLLRTELEKIKQEKEGDDFKMQVLKKYNNPRFNEYGPRDSSLKSTTGCDKMSDNSKENTDDSLEQHQMTNTETSSFESPHKINNDWKEKFFYPANHVESVNKIEKQIRKNNDAPIIEDWVSDDEDEVESQFEN
ncbi:hypothetical protein Tco_0878907 [Tanacetum coccineum]|uniref:DUF4219 domain-containing protein n=1 Tax=Tanacetum coccineum TaxID=301880 RepID=A0ABQ5BZL7_9ASTR